jgi:hypothetical protein
MYHGAVRRISGRLVEVSDGLSEYTGDTGVITSVFSYSSMARLTSVNVRN